MILLCFAFRKTLLQSLIDYTSKEIYFILFFWLQIGKAVYEIYKYMNLLNNNSDNFFT